MRKRASLLLLLVMGCQVRQEVHSGTVRRIDGDSFVLQEEQGVREYDECMSNIPMWVGEKVSVTLRYASGSGCYHVIQATPR